MRMKCVQVVERDLKKYDDEKMTWETLFRNSC
jgi:hypothetical protein